VYHYIPYYKLVSRDGVTIDGVWIGDSIYWPLIHSRLVTTLYKTLTHTDQCPKSITVFTSRFVETDFNTGTISVSLVYIFQISHIKSSLPIRNFNWALLQLTSCPKTVPVITTRHGPREKTALLLFVRIRCRRDMFTALMRGKGSYTDHRKYCSSVVIPLFLSCLLLREPVNRTVALKILWCICLSRGRCIVTALHATVF
jgi:hypothetical protein